MDCPDCKGSGKYVGLLVVETCATCGGSGQAKPTYGKSPLADIVGRMKAMRPQSIGAKLTLSDGTTIDVAEMGVIEG